MSEYVELLPSDVKYADDLARRRQAYNEQRDIAGANNAPATGDKALRLHILGARCELAAFLFLRLCADICRIVWHQYTDNNPGGLPDIDDFIDVKGRPEHWNDLIVQPKKLRTDWAYLLVYAHQHPRYEIRTWCWGHEIEANKQKYYRDPAGGRPAFFVPPTEKIMKPPNELCAELSRRHGWLDYQWF